MIAVPSPAVVLRWFLGLLSPPLSSALTKQLQMAEREGMSLGVENTPGLVHPTTPRRFLRFVLLLSIPLTPPAVASVTAAP